MRTILTIAHREYTAMIATKAFLLTLVLMPLLMLGGLLVLPLVNRIEGVQERRIVVADETGRYAPLLKAAAEARNTAVKERADSQNEASMAESMEGSAQLFLIEPTDSAPLDDETKLRLSEQIRSGELFALIEIPSSVGDAEAATENSRVTFVSNAAALSDVRGWVRGVLSSALRSERLQAEGIDPQIVAAADAPVEIASIKPYRPANQTDPKGGVKPPQVEEDSLATMFAPFLMMMLMFVVIFLAAQPMLESSMEEKTHRISEVLLGAVTPTQMMAGKLIGNVAGSMVIFVLYGIGGLSLLNHYDMLDLLPLPLVGWFLLFQILAVLLYSSVFMTVGAAVSQLKEAQSMLMPVWLVLVAPMMVWVVALRDPNGTISTAMSFFPPSAPLMMILRLGTGATVPAWQPPLAALLLLLSVSVVIVIAGRIYRASLLRGEGVRSLLQLLRRAA